MKRILLCFSLASLSSNLHAMEANKPNEAIAYPLNLSTILATPTATIYRNKVEYTLINNITRTKSWGSPQQSNYHYFVDATIDTAYTGQYHHHVYVSFVVNRRDKDASSCVYKVENHFFHIPIGFAVEATATIPTNDLGPLGLTVAVSSIENGYDSSDDDRN
jgi:hypothetical protein